MLSEEISLKYQLIPDLIERSRSILSDARSNIDGGDQRLAVNLCYEALLLVLRGGFLSTYGPEAESVIKDLKSCLDSLSYSSDEYVWEEAIQWGSDLRIYFPGLF